jgi:hypothetical protein
MASNLVDPEIGKLGDTDTAEVLLRFETGALCRIHCSRRAVYGYDQRVEVFGSNGMICSDNLPRTGIERYSASTTAARDALLPSFMERYLPTYELELSYFIEAVTNDARINADFESGRRAPCWLTLPGDLIGLEAQLWFNSTVNLARISQCARRRGSSEEVGSIQIIVGWSGSWRAARLG